MTQLFPIVNSGDHIYDNQFAPLEVVEYGDYQCPHCAHAYTIVKEIQQQLGSDMKFIFRNFPLSNIHPMALTAAVATEAANLQNRFWAMHDIIFENQQLLDNDTIFSYAQSIGLNMNRFKHDIRQKELADKVERDFESGIKSGVNRTPTFFINGIKFDGQWDDNGLLEYLKKALTEVSVPA